MSIQNKKTRRSGPLLTLHRLLLIGVIAVVCVAGAAIVTLHYRDTQNTIAADEAEGAKIATITQNAIKKAKERQARIQRAVDTEAAVAADASAPIPKPEPLYKDPLPCDSADPACIVVLVNKKHPLQPKAYVPKKLGIYSGATLNSEAGTHFHDMVTAIRAADLPLTVTSSYRSYGDQVETYDDLMRVNGSVAQADAVGARAGFSEHQTGLAVDLKVGNCALTCFESTATYAWLTKHAAEYGFIRRYPAHLTPITGYSPEAWHWRYVGTPTAAAMKKIGVKTLEEYLGIVGGDYAK